MGIVSDVISSIDFILDSKKLLNKTLLMTKVTLTLTSRSNYLMTQVTVTMIG